MKANVGVVQLLLLVINIVEIFGQVTLKLRALDCTDMCHRARPSSLCLSSIQINGNEYSEQDDGLNVAVINSTTGDIIQTKNFDKLSGAFGIDLFDRRKKKFARFFNNVSPGSLVVIVSQDMCSIKYDAWFEYLQDNVNIFHDMSWPAARFQNTAMIVGCVGECPMVAENDALPYIEFSTDPWHETEITFLEKGIATTSPTIKSTTPVTSKKKSKPSTQIALIIGIIFGLLILIASIAILVLLYRKQKFTCLKKQRRHDIVSVSGERTELHEYSAVDFGNASYHTDVNKDVIDITPKPQYYNTKSGPKYQECSTVNVPNNEYQCLGAHSQSPQKHVEENQYEYIAPKKEQLEADNIYYASSEQATSNNNDFSRARSVTELTNLSDVSSSAHAQNEYQILTLNKETTEPPTEYECLKK